MRSTGRVGQAVRVTRGAAHPDDHRTDPVVNRTVGVTMRDTHANECKGVTAVGTCTKRIA